MTSQRWWVALGGLLLIAVLLRVYALVAFIVIVLMIALIARWWQLHSLDDVNYERQFTYSRGYPGEQLEMQIIVENRKFLPLPWLRVIDPIPRLVGPEDESLMRAGMTKEQAVLQSMFSLRWYERDRRMYSLLLRQRGVYRLGPASLESGDLFGLFTHSQQRGALDYITVLPKPIDLKALHLPADDPLGDRSARRRLYEDPNRPIGVREYHPEDDYRRVHWPATARTGQLHVKIYQPISAQVTVLCLNITTLKNYWEGTDPALLEHLVGVTAALAQRAVDDGYRVGLVSNGALAHADHPFRIPPGRSPTQLAHILTALARVTPFVTGTFDRFLMAEVPRLPYRASLVVITGVNFQSLSETLLRLKRHGRRITLLSFDRNPPESIPGIHTMHRPFYSS